jgi:nucleoside-diphosphate-sugar epimerase
VRVVVTGATGNVGSSVIAALGQDPSVDSIVGLARRRPEGATPKVAWYAVDVASDPLEPVVRGADVLIHLAWAIQPSHDLGMLHATNVEGSRRVLEATAAERVPAIVFASSVGVYSPGRKGRRVDESWPTHGIPTSFYSRHKAAVERFLDAFEVELPDVRVVRLRPALSFQRSAAEEIRRLFIGRLVPPGLLRPALMPVVPHVPGLSFQAVHTDDVAQAYRLAAVGDARGPFNIAAEPPLDTGALAEILGARPLRTPERLIRLGAAATWRLRLQPTPPGWVDMALQGPLVDASRAWTELGWEPRHTASAAVTELLEGFAERGAGPTPPLAAGW